MLVHYAILTKLLGTVVLTLTTHSEGGNEEPMGRWAGEETELQGQRDVPGFTASRGRTGS